ncbi:flavodoxin family protein [Pseudodesulfovibrio piezophilus]|uniref:Putative Iron-sulfur flavoprotein n=1 Tax=Pseudodesulfovibrio piezophilus (strain DSM 21447 / JCM 15486 / C1TLV30) TaxID=1322246 RepID=M1WJV1_PSEP2|nr:NAD(P)H-dependent oxidoreductase [Pseudodesulfovibrio piezophilus]CCH48536.1 putative Iron-sulfur flavoprotein [Pseudodesulfovibrio piezophilus C1TLV30]
MKAVIYTASHRREGNTDRVAELLEAGVIKAGGKSEIIHVRDRDVRPCLACGYCDKSTHLQGQQRCILGKKDEAWAMFEPMFTAQTVFFASPIYFYHLPSRLKTWIDRGQQFWKARIDKETWIADLPRRTVHSVLVAGQPEGIKLFEGARLTLKYFVANFNMKLASPLTFRGVDAAEDLRHHTEMEKLIVECGQKAWQDATLPE